MISFVKRLLLILTSLMTLLYVNYSQYAIRFQESTLESISDLFYGGLFYFQFGQVRKSASLHTMNRVGRTYETNLVGYILHIY